MKNLFRYKYPKRKSNVLLYKSQTHQGYCFFDYSTETFFPLTDDEYQLALHLDGKTDPFTVNTAWSGTYVKSLLEAFITYDIITYSRLEREGFFTWSLSVVSFKKPTWTARYICTILSRIQAVCFFPVLCLGAVCYMHASTFDLSWDHWRFWICNIVFLWGGAILHELGHAVNGIAYGAKVFEAGLLIFPVPGAFVSMNSNSIKNKMQIIQIHAGGVENNLFLTGCLLFLSSVTASPLSLYFSIGAFSNLTVALINLAFLPGLDGYSLLQTLLGTKSDFLSDAWRYLRSLKNRKKGSVKAILSKEKAAIAGILFIYQLISILFLFGLVLEEILCS